MDKNKLNEIEQSAEAIIELAEGLPDFRKSTIVNEAKVILRHTKELQNGPERDRKPGE